MLLIVTVVFQYIYNSQHYNQALQWHIQSNNNCSELNNMPAAHHKKPYCWGKPESPSTYSQARPEGERLLNYKMFWSYRLQRNEFFKKELNRWTWGRMISHNEILQNVPLSMLL